MANAGFPEVREKVAAYLNKKHGMSYDKNDIIMTVGAAGGLNDVLRALLNPGDEVLTFAPFFTEYRSYAGNFGGKLVIVPPDTEHFQLDIEKAWPLITEKTKALIINNPNNPSGSLYTKETIEKLGAMLEKKEKEVGHPIYVICDEPYRELVYDGAEVPYIPAIIRNAVFLYSFSKTISLPGERIGYLALSKDVDEYPDLIQALTIANRTLGYVNAPSLFQLIVGDCLDLEANLPFYDKNRKLLYKSLTDIGFTCVKPEGAFYMLVKAPDGDAAHFAAAAEKLNIIIVPCDGFGLPGYVRLAYCVAYDMIERSLPAFKKLYEETK
jgi:aspartate aminotransferase